MRKILIALITVALLAFSACSVSVTAGKVTDKRYVEPTSKEVEITERDCDREYSKKKKKWINDCDTEGTGEFKTVTTEAEWYLTLEDKDGNDQEHEVSEDDYNSVEVGDQFDTKK